MGIFIEAVGNLVFMNKCYIINASDCPFTEIGVLMPGSRVPSEWMFDLFDQMMSAHTPSQILFWGKYVQYPDHLLLALCKRLQETDIRAYRSYFAGRSPETYVFYAFTRGLDLLLGDAEVEPCFQVALSEVQEAFLRTEKEMLKPVSVIGYIIWALNYHGREILTPGEADSRDFQAGIFLEALLLDDERKRVRELRGASL